LIAIPQDKRNKCFQKTLSMLNKELWKIRHLQALLVSLISVCPAAQYGILHIKILEMEKFLALSATNGDFDAWMSLPESIRENLLWWKDIFTDRSQRNKIRPDIFVLKIFLGASLTGWETVCDESWPHGFWSAKEKLKHINYLEILAVFHALWCFAFHLRSYNVLVRVDNLMALSYLNLT